MVGNKQVFHKLAKYMMNEDNVERKNEEKRRKKG